jgi:hypothetical protein
MVPEKVLVVTPDERVPALSSLFPLLALKPQFLQVQSLGFLVNDLEFG